VSDKFGPCIVTGASGFLGRALVSHLDARGVPVVAVARQETAYPASIRAVTLSSYIDVPFLDGAVLIHLAEESDIGAANAGGSAHIDTVTMLARSLFRHPWRRLVYVSSGAVYDQGGTGPKRPGDPTRTDGSPYVVGKLAVEAAVEGCGGVTARLANIYGPKMKPGTVISDIMAQIPGRQALRIRDSRPVRDFLWVGDAAAALAAVAFGIGAGTYNVGTGVGTSIGDVARHALIAANEQDRPIQEGQTDVRTTSVVLDISATTADFGWRPTIALQDGLRRMLR